ncbi:NAD(P)-dependent oxidoreductase [Egibacter rhizosphaerae]|uniref:NAD(P)-dependent oxidoreductase n=1 Tax=Egibacter rhizosphaerae TaxID=1670831 RepID=A0A411YHP0_9ACTN|nr:NAD(P)-dependent oxidoreductase [Egibacter rhizosphaerae]QBI20788.1 NAD(P)-dependent oxidoreductase [Egibacter rhizosphaerae]
MKVGFVGLGVMGQRMASRLQDDGFELVVHDVREDAAGAVAGAAWADSPREVAASCEVVLTSLPGPPQVAAVALGESGLAEGLSPGSAVFDLSTNSRRVVLEVADGLARVGAHFFDAPVSGGPRGAASGRLAIWVGGDGEVLAKHEAVLRSLGDEVRHIGEVGQATVAKLVHNCCSNTVRTVLAEAFTMGVKAGVDPLTLWSALRQGANGRARTFDRLADQFLTGQYDPPSFALDLAHKDMSLAAELGRELDVPMRLSSLVLEEMTEALNRGWGERDSRVPMLLQVERANVDIQVSRDDIQEVLDADPP